MLLRFATFFLAYLGLSSRAHDPVPSVFDGQYSNPTPKNGRVEWKAFQLVADSVGNNPAASITIFFYQGYLIQLGPRNSSLPEYYLDVTGTFSNGTTFSVTVPAEFADITSRGQAVTGKWGSVGKFQSSADLSSYTATFTAPQYGLEGSFTMKSRGKPHLNCNITTDPTFSSAISDGTKLTDPEDYIYNHLGWMTSLPGGSGSVDLKVLGSKLKFNGQAYHDANYAPGPLNTAVETWYASAGALGPYDMTYIVAVPINSTKVLNAGHLAYNGIVLQNQCSVVGPHKKDTVTVTPYGLVADTETGDNVPAGFIVEYTLVNEDRYRFNLSSIRNIQVPRQVIYHRWAGKVTGGKVGGKVYEGPYMYEWFNPFSKPYVPPA